MHEQRVIDMMKRGGLAARICVRGACKALPQRLQAGGHARPPRQRLQALGERGAQEGVHALVSAAVAPGNARTARCGGLASARRHVAGAFVSCVGTGCAPRCMQQGRRRGGWGGFEGDGGGAAQGRQWQCRSRGRDNGVGGPLTRGRRQTARRPNWQGRQWARPTRLKEWARACSEPACWVPQRHHVRVHAVSNMGLPDGEPALT